MVHSEVSFIIYATLIFAVRFVVSFERLAKTFQVLKMICGSYSRSYLYLFLIYAVTHDTRKYKPSQIQRTVLTFQKIDLIQKYWAMLTYNLITEIAVARWGNKDPKLSCPDEIFSYPRQAGSR